MLLTVPTSDFDERDSIWIWHYLKNNKNFNEPIPPYEQRILLIGQQINNFPDQQDILNKIKLYKLNNIIEDKYFNWINKDNVILIIALISLCIRKYSIEYLLHGNLLISPYDYLLLIFDSQENINLQQKISDINELKIFWGEVSYIFRQTKWLNQDDQDQVDWVHEYIQKIASNDKTGLFNFLKPPIGTSKEKYESIMAFFVYLEFLAPDPSIIFRKKIAGAWAQKKFRDSGKSKKPYHLPLTEQAKKKLDELANFYALKPNAMLEKMINQTYSTDILDEKGKKQYKDNE